MKSISKQEERVAAAQHFQAAATLFLLGALVKGRLSTTSIWSEKSDRSGFAPQAKTAFVDEHASRAALQKNAQASRQLAAVMLVRSGLFDEQRDDDFFLFVFSDHDFCFCFTWETGRHLDLLR